MSTTEGKKKKKKQQIFILSGQSNMSGRGGVKNRKWDQIIPPQCHPHPSILRFSASSQWLPAAEPLHADIDSAKTCGIGPGLPFARRISPLLPNTTIGLVPCAIGGTAIREWQKEKQLYHNMLTRTKQATGDHEIGAVLWFQGESDTSSAEAAESYMENMETLIKDVRSDLGLPSLPFIQVALASGDEPWMNTVREVQLQLGTRLPNVVCVDAKGLPLNEDGLHLSTQAQVLLGEMLAEAFVSNFFIGEGTEQSSTQ